MANQSGFQSNTTITAAFWWFKPDPSNTTDHETILEINSINKIESSTDHSKVWLYYAASTGSTNQQPYILTGNVAVAFMNDMESLFS